MDVQLDGTLFASRLLRLSFPCLLSLLFLSFTSVSFRVTTNRRKTFNPLFFSWPTQPLGRQRRLIIEVLRSHSKTPHSVIFLWTSDQPDAVTCTWQHIILTIDSYPCTGGIRTRNPSKQAAARPQIHALDIATRGNIFNLLTKSNLFCHIFFYVFSNINTILSRNSALLQKSTACSINKTYMF